MLFKKTLYTLNDRRGQGKAGLDFGIFLPNRVIILQRKVKDKVGNWKERDLEFPI